MIIFTRQFIVLLLILLQLVAPLLHAHSGIEPNQNRLHLPGLEIIDDNLSGLLLLEPISQDEDLGVVVGVCTGIKRVTGIAQPDSEIPFIPSGTGLISDFQFSYKHTAFQFKSPPINQLVQTNSSRAPPLLAS